jgi:hypothetical protein
MKQLDAEFVGEIEKAYIRNEFHRELIPISSPFFLSAMRDEMHRWYLCYESVADEEIQPEEKKAIMRLQRHTNALIYSIEREFIKRKVRK